MSSIVRAVIPGVMVDVACVREALSQLRVGCEVRGRDLVLANGLTITEGESGLVLVYREGVNAGQFVEDFTRTYRELIEQKLAALRVQEARLREDAALQMIDDKERVQKLARIEADRARLEETQRREREELRRICEQKARILRTKAESSGYTVREELKDNKRILVLVRRSR